MQIPKADLERIRGLYERGLYMQAYQCAMAHGRLSDWTGTDERILAGRLVQHLGAPRLAMAMHLRTWRAAPTNLEARYYAAHVIAARHGAWAGWRFLCDSVLPDDCPNELRAHYLALRARIAAALRDFETAEQALAQAAEYAPSDDWLEVTTAIVLLDQDRDEEALRVARAVLTLRKGWPHALLVTAQALTAVGRDREALELLLDAFRETESGVVVSFLVALQLAFGDPGGALESLDRLEALSPLAETTASRALAGQRSEAHYACGNTPAAIRFARESENPFLTAIADRLERADLDAKRVELPVGFVKQHHSTCSPATLTAISRFWSRDAQHVEVAEEICYDGTPAHSERAWAQRHGWLAREFTVTWDAGVALLDRRIPFTLTTTGPTGAHLQAVIGYDVRRGTFLVRDPSFPNLREFRALAMLDAAKSTGPRGMLMVPEDRLDLLDGVGLPDVDLWDRAHAVHTALEAHDRPRAYEIYREMSSLDPEHIVTLSARRALAAYDGDDLGILAFADRMLSRFTDDPRSQLARLVCLSNLERENESLEFLEKICDANSHPALQVALAQRLGKDARRHDDVRRLLRGVFRVGYLEAECFFVLGNLEWSAGRFDNALESYRVAACLGDKNENLAMNYFLQSCHRGHSTEAEHFLERRAQRLGSRSPNPLITLGEAYCHLGRPGRALETLDRALKLHPEDADSFMGAARLYARCGRPDRVDAMLTLAESAAKRTDWMRAAAELATDRDDLEQALDHWRRVLEIEPLAADAHAGVARLLATTRGPRGAIDHLEATCSRFPHNVTLQRLRVEWLLEHDGEAAEPVLISLIETNSVNAWARLRLAQLLGERGAIREALAEAELACLLDPTDPWAHVVRARLCGMDGRDGDAAAGFGEAIRLSVGSEMAIQGLFAVCRSDDDRRRGLALVRREILRQASADDAPLIYRSYAHDLLGPDELFLDLQELLEVRPDHRRVWTATMEQLVAMDRIDEAREIAERCVERFPLELQAWLDAARLRLLAGDTEGETQALRQALRIAPGAGFAYRRLFEIAGAEDRDEEARQLLETAVAMAPLDALNHGWLAELLWQSGERLEALTRLETALSLDPEYEWAGNSLRDWSAQSDDPDRGVAFARRLSERRAGDARAWLLLADLLVSDDRFEERLAAVDRAIGLAPRSTEAHDRRATLLANAGRFEEALESCRPEIWSDRPPIPLRGRAAWIEARRGQPAAAIRQMQAILKESPDYTWGWHRLTEWFRDAGAEESYLEAAENLVLHSPGDPVGLAIRGHAKLVSGELKRAESDLGMAFELAPSNVTIGLLLFDVRLDTYELDAAERTLNELRRHVDRSTSLALEVRIGAAQRDQPRAVDALTELLSLPEIDDNDVASAVDVARAKWRKQVDLLMDALIERPGINPVVGELWIRARAGDLHWRACYARIDALPVGEEITSRATAAFLESLARAHQISQLRRYVRKHRAILHADVRLWSTAIHTLASRAQWSFLVRWAGAWQGRQGLEPWMLSNLALALRNKGRHEDATQVNRLAIMLEADRSTPSHALWLAVEEAIAGEQAVAETFLAQVPRTETDAGLTFMITLVRAMAEVNGAEASTRASSFEKAAAILTQARNCFPGYRREPDLRSAYRRCARSIGRRCRGVPRVLWLVRVFRG